MAGVGGGLPIVEIRPPGRAPLLVVVGRRLEVGRDCDGVQVDDELLSRRHLALDVRDGVLHVEDLGSRNGTEIDGAPVRGTRAVAPGATLRAGRTEIRTTHLVAAAAPADGRPAPPRLVDTVDADVSGPLPSVPTTVQTVAHAALHDPGLAHRAAAAAPRRTGATMTFLFSDIEGSTRRAEAVGDRAWVARLSDHNRIVEREIAGHGGTVVKAIGDGYMATFESALAAAHAAIAVQRSFAAEPVATVDGPLRVRIGLHTGEAIAVGDDLFGLHVNVAARVADQAEGGQILVSALTRAVIEVSGDVRFVGARETPLKGLSGEHRVSELAWEAP